MASVFGSTRCSTFGAALSTPSVPVTHSIATQRRSIVFKASKGSNQYDLSVASAKSKPSSKGSQASKGGKKRDYTKHQGPHRLRKHEKEALKAVRNDGSRLAKVLAAAGVDSRRNCEALIADGRVKVNGKVITEVPFHVNPTKDKILVDGVGIQTVQPSKYFMLHKPKGYVCSAVQQPGLMAKPVVSLLKPWLQEWRKGKPINAPEPRFFTVGRLDVNTTGLMLVTNDGQWAQKVSHPATEVHKEYIVKVDEPVTVKQIATMQEGCTVAGRHVTPVYVDYATLARSSADRLRVVVQDGRKHEVRELVKHAGLECLQLRRIRIGGLRLPDKLTPGKYRELKSHELKLVFDRGASHNALTQKVQRILTSGKEADQGRKIGTSENVSLD